MAVNPERDPIPGSESHSQETDSKKKTPFVDALLDAKSRVADHQLWMETVLYWGMKVTEEINGEYREMFPLLTVLPLYIFEESDRSERDHILNQTIDKNIQIEVMIGLIAAGFEIGDVVGVDKVKMDLAVVLGLEDVFNPETVKKDDGAEQIEKFVAKLLRIGVYLKRVVGIDGKKLLPRDLASLYDLLQYDSDRLDY